MNTTVRWSVISLVVGAGIGWIFLPTPLAICGAYASQSAPAWAQAIFSVLAIFAAIAIAWGQQRVRDRGERMRLQLRTRAVMLRLPPALSGTMEDAMEVAAKIREEDPEKLTPTGVKDLCNRTTLWVIPRLMQYDKELPFLAPELQKVFVELLAKCDQYSHLHGRLYDSKPDKAVSNFKRCKESLVLVLEEISGLASNTYGRMQRLKENG